MSRKERQIADRWMETLDDPRTPILKWKPLRFTRKGGAAGPTPVGEEFQPGPTTVRFAYLNHRGKAETRTVTPGTLFYGDRPPWYPEPQWLLHGYDHDRQAFRTFALAKIRDWEPWEAKQEGDDPAPNTPVDA